MSDTEAHARIYPNGNVEYGSGAVQHLPNGGVAYQNGISTGVAPDTNGRYAAVVWSGDQRITITDPQTVSDIEATMRIIAPQGVNAREQSTADNLIRGLLAAGNSRGITR